MGVFGLLASGMVSVFALICIILEIIAYWRIFTKAGQAGWKSIIPVYSQYISFKIAWKPAYFWLTFALTAVSSIVAEIVDTVGYAPVLSMLVSVFSIALFVFYCIYCVKLAKSFGKGVGFGVGLIFLNFIFTLILGFGSAEYIGPDQDEKL